MRKHIPLFLEKTKDIPLLQLTGSLQAIRDLHINALK